MKSNPVHGALFGLAIGDVLGVPVESWTAGGEVFGVGKTTEESITRLRDGISPGQSGNFHENK